MRKKIEEYNSWLYNFDISNLPIGLFDGKMGLCIYWYIQARCFNDITYETLASELLDSVYEELSMKKYEPDLENGIIGIAFAIDFLLINGFVDGNKEEVLNDVDDTIYRNLYFEHINNKNMRSIVDKDELWAGFYFAKRLQDNDISSEKVFLYKRILMEIVNRSSSIVNTFLYTEPVMFAPLSYLYLTFLLFVVEVAKCNFYNNKLNLMLEEWKNDIQSILPYSNGHKNIIHNLLSRLTQITQNNGYSRYLNVLRQYADIEYFIHNELFSRNVDISRGISSWALFLYQTGNIKKSNLKSINNKIDYSILWEDWKKNIETTNNVDNYNVGLFHSLTGVIATYQIVNEIWKR